MKTLILIWLLVLVVGVLTINRVGAWTRGVNVYHDSTAYQSPIGLQSEPSRIQPAINVKEF